MLFTSNSTAVSTRETGHSFDPPMPGSFFSRDYPPAARLVWRYVLPALRVGPGVRSPKKPARYWRR